MPSVSPAQKHTMAAIAHGWHPHGFPGAAKLARIPVKVAKEFNEADTRGGDSHADKLRARGVISNRAHARMKGKLNG